MCCGLNAFLSRNSFARRHPSLSTVNNTPEEIILCAVLWLFPRCVEAVRRQLKFWLVSLEWIKSVPNQCQEKGSRVVWARAVSSSTSATLFSEWLGNKLYICVYIWEKERSGKETDGCYQSWGWQSALKETFLPPPYILPTLRTLALKSWVGLVGGEVKAWFSSSPVSFAHAV